MMAYILLVEDDAALSRGIALALAADDRTIVQAETASVARAHRADTRFDLVILDINLPDANGLDLLRAWRAEGDVTPVILLTANDLEMDEVVGLEAGANDYITKPFSLAVLRARGRTAACAGGAGRGTDNGALSFRFCTHAVQL